MLRFFFFFFFFRENSYANAIFFFFFFFNQNIQLAYKKNNAIRPPIDIEGRSQSWPPYFPGMESNLGVFCFTRKVRVSTASFCDMSVFLTAQESRDLRDAHQSYRVRNMHCAFLASFLGKIPNTPKLFPMPGKKFTWAVLKLWDLCLYICGPPGGLDSFMLYSLL